VLVAGPRLPGPLSLLQQGLAAMLNLDVGGATDLSGAYPLAIILQGLVLVGGSAILWITTSWRLGKFAPLTLLVFVTVSVGLLVMANRSPRGTLAAWIVIAALAIAYIHYYRKGRFGYTRGATGAVFSYLTLIAFFLAFPLVLIEVFGGAAAVTSVADGSAIDAGGEPTTDAREGAGSAECSIMEMTSQGCPEDVASSEEAASEAIISLDDADYPPHDVRKRTGGIEVATDTTSPRELRALFDLQRAWTDPSVAADFRDGGAAGEFEELARGLGAGLQRDFGSSQSLEVRIRCASVPDVQGVDPTLAIGAFALSDQGAEQIGLASTDEVLFELSDRRDCTPPPVPPSAVTAEEVFAAVERAGLEVTNPRKDVIGDYIGGEEVFGPAVGLSPCYAFGCLHKTRTDQFTVTVWPTAEAAKAATGTDSAGAAGGAAVLEGGFGPLTWLGASHFVANPFKGPAAQFGPVTTVHLSGNWRAREQTIGCQDPDPDACTDAYMERVQAAAATFEQAPPR
jgi:hypothetical protein